MAFESGLSISYFLALVFATSHRPGTAFLPDLFFLSNYLPNAISGGWSLSTEEQFYIVMPLLLLAISAVVPVRRQYITIAVLLALLPMIRWLTLRMHQVDLTQDEFRRIVQLPFHTHADGLVAGVLLSWVAVLRPRLIAPMPFVRNLLLPFVLMCLGLVLRVMNPRVFGFSGLALIFAGMTLFALRDQTIVTRLSKIRIFYVTSRLSYGMYLNHFPVLALCVPLIVLATASP